MQIIGWGFSCSNSALCKFGPQPNQLCWQKCPCKSQKSSLPVSSPFFEPIPLWSCIWISIYLKNIMTIPPFLWKTWQIRVKFRRKLLSNFKTKWESFFRFLWPSKNIWTLKLKPKIFKYLSKFDRNKISFVNRSALTSLKIFVTFVSCIDCRKIFGK